jgi:hypothetical protein
MLTRRLLTRVGLPRREQRFVDVPEQNGGSAHEWQGRLSHGTVAEFVCNGSEGFERCEVDPKIRTSS